MNDKFTRLIIATAYGTIAVSVLVALLTIIGEEWAPLKNWLKATFSHHWLGKSYLSCALFIVTTIVTYPFTKNTGVSRAVWLAFYGALAATIALCGYFLLHVLHIV